MARLKIRFILASLTLLSSTVAQKSIVADPNSGIDTDDGTSSIDLADYHPSAQFGWSSVPIGTQIKRERRDLAPDAKLEKIAASKNYREARLMGSPETWAKQPLAVQFRPRPGVDHMPIDRYDDEADIDEAANLPPLIRAHYAPKTDFITSGRGRGPMENGQGRLPPLPEGRESREMPIARSYDEYDVPIFRNVVREHDFDVQLPRNYYYPNRYRSQRDYYYRGAASAPPTKPYHPYDRYRDEDEEYEMYNGRYNRPVPPKPKRIIYYATLPEIVRKPVDLRNYQRPYDPMARAPDAPVDPERPVPKPVVNNIEPSARRPLRYPPYDSYDNYVKRSSYYDRRRPTYLNANDDRAREEERIRASLKEKIRSDDRKPDNGQIARSGNDRRIPWPVQIGAEVNIKDSERLPGRKIYGQVENYDRYDGSRIKKDNAERKEDLRNQDGSNSSNSSNNSSSDRNINDNNGNNN